MFLTVTPNLCIERTVEISMFSPSRVHRVENEKLFVNAGGKGINAARVAAKLGGRVLALSWVGKHQRAWFAKQLQREGVAHDLIEVESDTRVCTNILHDNGEKTEIVESGAPLSIHDGARMLERFEALLPRCELVAICGSYPPGVSTPDAPQPMDRHLTQMSELAQRRGRKLLVDGKGAAFESLLRSAYSPWAIKPNCDEAAALLHHPIQNESDERRAVEELLNFGVEVVILSCGARGAYLGRRESTLFFASPGVEEISAVGSGDALVGAFAAQYLQSNDLVEAMRWGVAAGAANAAQKLSAFCKREEVEVLLPRVQVQRV
jgi:1-phosphofructokinase family hexose kinase